jgi:hypothetical protein
MALNRELLQKLARQEDDSAFIKEYKRQTGSYPLGGYEKAYYASLDLNDTVGDGLKNIGRAAAAVASGGQGMSNRGSIGEGGFGKYPDVGKGLQDGVMGVVSSLKGKLGFGAALGSMLMDGIESAFGLVKEGLVQERDLRNQINSAMTISGELGAGFKDTVLSSLPALAQMEYGYQEVRDSYLNMVEASGRLQMFNENILKDAGATSMAFVDNFREMGDLIYSFAEAGYGAEDALAKINDAGLKSTALGLNAKRVVSELTSNLGKLNEYGFDKGVEGLTKMVQKSIQFKMNLSDVFTLADKVMNPENAISLSAELQAIGGAIGDLNDPIKLMYMSTNNVEGLGDALLGVTSTLTTFNDEQGRFEVAGANLRRVKAIAEQLGTNYKDLIKTSIAHAEQTQANNALMASGLDLKPEQRDFLTNLSRMEGGKVVIDIPESIRDSFYGEAKVELDRLNSTQTAVILKNQKLFEQLSVDDVARAHLTETQKMQADIAAIRAKIVGNLGKTATAEGNKLDEAARPIYKVLNDEANKAASGRGGVVDNIYNQAAVKLGLGKEKSTVTTSNVNPPPPNKTQVDNTQAATVIKSSTDNAQASKQQTVNGVITVRTNQTVMDAFTRVLYEQKHILNEVTRTDSRSYTA